jgi:hypothetical protein
VSAIAIVFSTLLADVDELPLGEDTKLDFVGCE